ncbi:GntR family transcriptional regulator [Amycolatopsis antarctica]|uniref:GntR family transcriptional regulator n=1 Tax=Amycolatopsis antarctica TaxID=1854586 RepID=A0A263D4S5_9PSEU|nr:GntR family transcriptional regulator [Amycolatopsis antarctica]OZM72476.1 GntR family transcriptional regulator [Amycolatopsis antarctica]
MVDIQVVIRHSDMPIYRQIVTQLSFMIENGDLRTGQTLPSARLLADNLHINRNTVARAYVELNDMGLVESRGRGGTCVSSPVPTRNVSPARERAREILETATKECIDLGVSVAEIKSLVAGLAMRAEVDLLKVLFVECNADRAGYFAGELSSHVGLTVKPLVLGEFDPDTEQVDLVLTTFFHLAEVRTLWRRSRTEVVAIVVAPHVQTLVQIASVPKNKRIGILYSTDDQAASIKDSLTQSGIHNIEILRDVEDQDIEGVDLVVVPSEMPHLKSRLDGRVKVIEFGNVLDAASIRMVTEVVSDMRTAKREAAPEGPAR